MSWYVNSTGGSTYIYMVACWAFTNSTELLPRIPTTFRHDFLSIIPDFAPPRTFISSHLLRRASPPPVATRKKQMYILIPFCYGSNKVRKPSAGAPLRCLPDDLSERCELHRSFTESARSRPAAFCKANVKSPIGRSPPIRVAQRSSSQ